MSELTENIGLTMPAGTEKYSLDVNNENLAKIDAALGGLQEAVGSNLGDKIGNHDDTEAGTVFGDLNIIKDQAEQNGTDIAEIKQTAKGNSDKLTALQATAGNTKTVVDVINTNTETVKQNTETLKTTANGISAKVENIKANVSGNGTKLDTLDGKADVISGQVQTVGNNVSSVKTTVENVGGKVDTAISLLNELKTALANANTNIATLLTQSKGVKAIVSGQITTPPTNPYKIDATIPDTMNAEKVVVLATAHSTASNVDSGIAWVRDGHTVTFAANNKVISYQFIEFY